MANPKVMINDETFKVISQLPFQFQATVVNFFGKYCIGITTAPTQIKLISFLIMKNSHLTSLIEMLYCKLADPISIDHMLSLLQGLASLKMDAGKSFC